VNNASDRACRSAIEWAQQRLGGRDRAWVLRRGSCAQAVNGRPDIVADVGDEPHVEGSHGVERLAGEVGTGQFRPSATLHDRRCDDCRKTSIRTGEGERDRRIDDDEITGRHQPDPAARTGPSTAAITELTSLPAARRLARTMSSRPRPTNVPSGRRQQKTGAVWVRTTTRAAPPSAWSSAA
jgi:hypothetical protein